ncbi:galactose-1-phosphate uridylyltransferase [Halapricum salinum]|uniref:UDP-glucose--hexose-1-phosphate uridylyltransferase n=1 Tax=Halapricum salinum TaxID=1457250 RepID=A0A4D6HFH7_9EURY|nr:galactose-1-phosphate uridylyltransferase [Halapricum salinum]QCC52540.1 galactose-1-phosphate uridylyltransferase [Halapricum salinum]
MTERRWDPFQREWVVTATHRQDRTFKPPKDYCPFCPTEADDEYPTAIPEPEYDVAVVENAFPSLQPDPPEPAVESTDLFRSAPANGTCEVVLFTDDHDAAASAFDVERFQKLARVWQDRYVSLGDHPDHEYVYIFENRGEEIGVTLEHPHGQIYAYPFVPPKIERELDASAAHHEENGACLFCDVLAAERKDGSRLVSETDHFTAIVPFQARYAYEMHVYADDHLPSIADFEERHLDDLGRMLKDMIVRYDGLFGFELPYVMAVHQEPTTAEGAAAAHFHIEFYPPHRTAEKLKHLAGSERGAGTYVNNKLAEEAAAELRSCIDSS